MRSERFEFPNGKGEKLAGVLDLPLGEPTAFALFAHCFTCGKDIRAAKASPSGWRSAASRCCASISPGWAAAKANSPTRIFPPTSTTWSPPPTTCARRGARRRC